MPAFEKIGIAVFIVSLGVLSADIDQGKVGTDVKYLNFFLEVHGFKPNSSMICSSHASMRCSLKSNSLSSSSAKPTNWLLSEVRALDASNSKPAVGR